MKILHLYKSFYPETLGGVEQLILNLTNYLETKAVQSDVMVTTEKLKAYELTLNQAKVYFFPQNINKFSCPMSWQFIKAFRKLAKEYDVLHFHYPWPFVDLTYLLSFINKPSVLTYHSDIVKQKNLNRMYAPLRELFLRKVHCIAPTSKKLSDHSRVLQRFSQKTAVIPIGMAKPTLSKDHSERVHDWQRRFFQPFFLFVGVLRYYKGLEFLLEALKDSQIPLVIAGTGPEEEKLKTLKTEWHLDNVHFLGKVSNEDKWALLEACYSVIAPAHLKTEAFCIALLEGLMFNKPLISTELGTGTSFVNTHGLTGLVVEKANPKALRKAMETLLQDEKLYQKFARNTNAHYENYFTLEKMGGDYLDIYQSL